MTTKTLEDDFEIKMFPLELYMGRLSLIMLRNSIDVLFHVEHSSLSIKVGSCTGRVYYIHKTNDDILNMESINPLELATIDSERILARFKMEIN